MKCNLIGNLYTPETQKTFSSQYDDGFDFYYPNNPDVEEEVIPHETNEIINSNKVVELNKESSHIENVSHSQAVTEETEYKNRSGGTENPIILNNLMKRLQSKYHYRNLIRDNGSNRGRDYPFSYPAESPKQNMRLNNYGKNMSILYILNELGYSISKDTLYRI
ncbi:hypothetical protein GLOIN_2v1787214 [Rhizophagus clarus]|uniref:Uncharacterized protein n=1 Tax=Rhizophagus clarus TaxID=94130 RepID=A0A8H3QWE6_9GLOM|nr:hypothetical protein GLOIN_2v1787214 [Rhizophagus clarus]